MKFYVAAKLEEFQTALDAEALLKEAGHEITFSWATLAKQYGDSVNAPMEEAVSDRTVRNRIAIQEIEGVRSCDALIIFPHPRGRGQFVEMGAALALGKPVYVIAPEPIPTSELVFFFHPFAHRMPSLKKLLEFLS